jgi:hypothetical protein
MSSLMIAWRVSASMRPFVPPDRLLLAVRMSRVLELAALVTVVEHAEAALAVARMRAEVLTVPVLHQRRHVSGVVEYAASSVLCSVFSSRTGKSLVELAPPRVRERAADHHVLLHAARLHAARSRNSRASSTRVRPRHSPGSIERLAALLRMRHDDVGDAGTLIDQVLGLAHELVALGGAALICVTRRSNGSFRPARATPLRALRRAARNLSSVIAGSATAASISDCGRLSVRPTRWMPSTRSVAHALPPARLRAHLSGDGSRSGRGGRRRHGGRGGGVVVLHSSLLDEFAGVHS